MYLDYRGKPHNTEREMLIANAYYLRELEKEGQRPLVDSKKRSITIFGKFRQKISW